MSEFDEVADAAIAAYRRVISANRAIPATDAERVARYARFELALLEGLVEESSQQVVELVRPIATKYGFRVDIDYPGGDISDPEDPRVVRLIFSRNLEFDIHQTGSLEFDIVTTMVDLRADHARREGLLSAVRDFLNDGLAEQLPGADDKKEKN